MWAVLGPLATHPTRGAVALPLPARPYVRGKNLSGIGVRHRPAFHAGPGLAADPVRWAVGWPGLPGEPVRVVADGAYAAAPPLGPMRALGVTAAGRPRKGAALWTAPGPRPQHRRGPDRTYGENRIDPAGRAGQRRGRAAGTSHLYGRATAGRYKTFVATRRPAGGAIRVAPAGDPAGRVAFPRPDPAAAVAGVLVGVADRCAPGVAFRDPEDVAGAGRRRVRFAWASAGASHACLWAPAMTEARARDRAGEGSVGHRSASPRGGEPRRPGHAGERRARRRELLGEDIRAAPRAGVTEPGIGAAAERLLNLAA